MDSKSVSHFPFCPEDIDPWPFTSKSAAQKMVSMQADNTNWNPNPTLYYPCHRKDGTPVPDLQQLLLQKQNRGNRQCSCVKGIYCSVCSYESRFLDKAQELSRLRART